MRDMFDSRVLRRGGSVCVLWAVKCTGVLFAWKVELDFVKEFQSQLGEEGQSLVIMFELNLCLFREKNV